MAGRACRRHRPVHRPAEQCRHQAQCVVAAGQCVHVECVHDHPWLRCARRGERQQCRNRCRRDPVRAVPRGEHARDQPATGRQHQHGLDDVRHRHQPRRQIPLSVGGAVHLAADGRRQRCAIPRVHQEHRPPGRQLKQFPGGRRHAGGLGILRRQEGLVGHAVHVADHQPVPEELRYLHRQRGQQRQAAGHRHRGQGRACRSRRQRQADDPAQARHGGQQVRKQLGRRVGALHVRNRRERQSRQ
ncbi:hypothetical protein D9M70_327010 [compost metagenome]